MISPRLRIDHIDPEEWKRAQRILNPPGPGGRVGPPPAPPLVLFVEDGRVVKALRLFSPRPGGGVTAVERVDPASFGWAGPWSLGKLRRAAGAKVALALEGDVLDRLAAGLDGRMSGSDDLVAQILDAARAGKAELGKGVHLDPDVFSTVPVPAYAALQQTFDMLLPDDRSAGLFLFDRGPDGKSRIYTSLLVEKRGGDVVRLTSHHALGLSPSQITDFHGGKHRPFVDAMAARLAPPHLALFATVEAWREVVGPNPGAMAQQLAMREAVIDPAPPWLVALTGAAAVAGVAREASRIFSRFIPQSIKDTARDTARAMAPLAASPFSALGFDPIQLFVQLRSLF